MNSSSGQVSLADRSTGTSTTCQISRCRRCGASSTMLPKMRCPAIQGSARCSSASRPSPQSGIRNPEACQDTCVRTISPPPSRRCRWRRSWSRCGQRPCSGAADRSVRAGAQRDGRRSTHYSTLTDVGVHPPRASSRRAASSRSSVFWIFVPFGPGVVGNSSITRTRTGTL